MDLSDYDPSQSLSHASTLPSRWYIEPQFLEWEKQKVFSRTWQPVVRRDLLARPGDFAVCDVVGEPLVLTRDKNSHLRALSNVCRHRAGEIAVGRGNRKVLQCRYHGWTYTLDGRLFAQPEFEGVENWNKAEICLPSFPVEVWGPYAFVKLQNNDLPIADVLGNIPTDVEAAGIELDDMQLIEHREYVVHCNWKVYIDNYLEGYHIPIAHPGLFRELDYDKYRVDTFRYYSSAFAPIRPAAENDATHRDRRYVRSEAETKALYYWIFPNFMINIYPDNLQANIVLPLGHDKILTIFDWFFKGPGTGEGWESLQQSIAFSDQIQKEDMELCEAVQRNLNSRTYNQGRISVRRENGVYHFHQLLHEFLSQ